MDNKKYTKKLVVVADDFGFCDSVNKGVTRSYLEGIVTEISFMVKGRASKTAAALIKSKGIQNVGIHIELSTGHIMHEKDYLQLLREKTYAEVSKMVDEELELFDKILRKKPTHITAHKGIHGNFKLLRHILDYAKKYNIPIRRPHVDLMGIPFDDGNYAATIMIKRANLKNTNYLFIHVKGSDSTVIKTDFLNDLKKVKNGESAELIFHPGYFDQELLESSSLNYERSRDLAITIDKTFRNDIENLGFQIINYKSL